MALKSAWEIALDKHAEHERLQVIADQLWEHVALLEEGWDAIAPGPRPLDLDRARARRAAGRGDHSRAA